MRAVIDTNVLIAGLLWHGPPHALIENARAGRLSLISSPALLAELIEVLARPKFDAVFVRTRTSREHTVAEVQRLLELIDPSTLPHPVCRDPDDAQLLALSRAAQPDLIVSGDDDLLTLGSFEGVPIVSPAEAVHRLG